MANTTKSKSNQSAEDKTNIGISSSNSRKVANELNKVLADEFVLYVKTLKVHWNIEGRDFHALHLFLEEQYNQLQNIIDEVAERIRNIGLFSNGTMKQFLADASLKESTQEGPVSAAILAELAGDHESLIRDMRTLIDDFESKYDDAGSADFITGIMKKHEKMAWMLRSSAPAK